MKVLLVLTQRTGSNPKVVSTKVREPLKSMCIFQNMFSKCEDRRLYTSLRCKTGVILVRGGTKGPLGIDARGAVLNAGVAVTRGAGTNCSCEKLNTSPPSQWDNFVIVSVVSVVKSSLNCEVVSTYMPAQVSEIRWKNGAKIVFFNSALRNWLKRRFLINFKLDLM